MTEKYDYECYGHQVARFGGRVYADSVAEAARLAANRVHGSCGFYKSSYTLKVNLTRRRDKAHFDNLPVKMVLDGSWYVVPSTTLDQFMGVPA